MINKTLRLAAIADLRNIVHVLQTELTADTIKAAARDLRAIADRLDRGA
jgi:hypothetical protein